MDSNIKVLWGEAKARASQEWMNQISQMLIPAMESRGYKIGSIYAIDPAPGNELIAVWVFTKGDFYLEVHAHSANAFSVIGNDGDNALNWPTSSTALFDRKNYTVGYLMEWIDQLKT
jgi:hypothetical protein